MKPAGVVWLLFVALTATARADTITAKDHVSMNGTVKELSGGVISFEARFSSGSKLLRVELRAVESIEFNATSFNPGAPPRSPGFGPPLDSQANNVKDSAVTATIVLRGGQRRPCELISIDQSQVHCAGKDGDYNRAIVLRVLIGTR